jgi:hypothetical protein
MERQTQISKEQEFKILRATPDHSEESILNKMQFNKNIKPAGAVRKPDVFAQTMKLKLKPEDSEMLLGESECPKFVLDYNYYWFKSAIRFN